MAWGTKTYMYMIKVILGIFPGMHILPWGPGCSHIMAKDEPTNSSNVPTIMTAEMNMPAVFDRPYSAYTVCGMSGRQLCPP